MKMETIQCSGCPSDINANDMAKQSSYGGEILITDNLENKIRFMCSRLPDNEWSGVLFYKVDDKTSIFDKNIKIKAIDMIVMDIGSATFTEYEMTPEVSGYMVDNDLLDCKIGLIHSHDKMNAFFSGTDENTLKQIGNNTIHFVSLVVNDAGKYVARITSKINHETIGVESIVRETFDGKSSEKKVPVKSFVSDVVWDDLEIKIEKPFDSLDKRIDELKRAAENNRVSNMFNAGYAGYVAPDYRQDYSGVDYPSLFKDYNQTQQTSHIDQSDTKPQEYINNDDDDEGGWLDDFMTKN